MECSPASPSSPSSTIWNTASAAAAWIRIRSIKDAEIVPDRTRTNPHRPSCSWKLHHLHPHWSNSLIHHFAPGAKSWWIMGWSDSFVNIYLKRMSFHSHAWHPWVTLWSLLLRLRFGPKISMRSKWSPLRNSRWKESFCIPKFATYFQCTQETKSKIKTKIFNDISINIRCQDLKSNHRPCGSDQLEIILNISVGPTHLCPFCEGNWPAQFTDGSSMQIHCYQFLETEMLHLFTPLGHQPGLR